MDRKKPILSIVIPEKDRYKYLLPLLKLIDSFHLTDTEIVIEDNSDDTRQWQEFISNNTINTPIVYNSVKGQIPVKNNSENAILHSNGEFVCCIGDDDAVMPNIEECVRWMKTNGVDSMRQQIEITYKWPSYVDEQVGGMLGATLSYNPSHSIIKRVDAECAAEQVVKSNFSSLGHCPCVYHGIVARSVLDELYNINGSFMPGPSPDMANAMALSFVVKHHCVTDIPFVISGGSEYQGGRSSKVKSWVQPLSNIPFISEEDKSKWNLRIPYLWTGPTVWAESGLKGLYYVGRQDVAGQVDFDRIIVKVLLLLDNKNRRKLLAGEKNNRRNRILFFYRKERLRLFLSRFKKWLVDVGVMHYNNDRITLSGVISIGDAISLLKKNNDCSFNEKKELSL